MHAEHIVTQTGVGYFIVLYEYQALNELWKLDVAGFNGASLFSMTEVWA